MKYTEKRNDLYSKILNRDTHYLIYEPQIKRIKDSPLIIWLHGWGGLPHCEVFINAIESFSDTVDQPPVVLAPYGMEGEESSEWINKYDGSLSIESHLIDELIPEIKDKYSVNVSKNSIMICGVSMGGYGAVNIALRNQKYFCACAAFSPQGFKIPLEPPPKEAKFPEEILKHIPGLTTPYENDIKAWGPLPDSIEHRKANSPYDYIDNINVEIGIYIDVGNSGFPEEMMLQDVSQFQEKLKRNKIEHIFELFNGSHGGGLNPKSIERKLNYLYRKYYEFRN